MLEHNLHILEQIKYKLTQPMPGDKPRKLLAPFINGVNQRRYQPFPDSKKSAVLLLLWEQEAQLNIVFTLRSRNLLSHSGQISFPGGVSEENETPVQTALRETEEEIGVPQHTIEILGQLSPLFVLPSNSNIFPIVGCSQRFLDMKINHAEVEEAFSKPIDYFTFNNILQRKWKIRDEIIDIPYWSIHPSVPLWGATAMILAEFIEIYRSIGQVIIEP